MVITTLVGMASNKTPYKMSPIGAITGTIVSRSPKTRPKYPGSVVFEYILEEVC